MATNFRIAVQGTGETFRLKLEGDFDGISAHELLKFLKKRTVLASKVFVETSNLKNIYPFGLHVFSTNLHSLKRRSVELVFTGEKASQFETAKTIAS
jgi:anti-anti-sigma regulatory factor